MTGKIGLYDSNNSAYKVYVGYAQQWGPMNNNIVIGTCEGKVFIYESAIGNVRDDTMFDQFEISIGALEWLILVMARFKLPSDYGGYPDDQFTDFLQLGKDVDLSVFRGLHHNLGEMYFSVTNRAMTMYDCDDLKMSWDIFDRDVDEHNLSSVFQRIIDDSHSELES